MSRLLYALGLDFGPGNSLYLLSLLTEINPWSITPRVRWYAREIALFVVGEEEAEVAQVLAGGTGDDGVAQSGEHGAGVEVGQ